MKHKNPNMGMFAQYIARFGGSEKARDFFWTMTDRAWEKWQARYHLILVRKGSTLEPPMTWWEQEFDRAVRFADAAPFAPKKVQ